MQQPQARHSGRRAQLLAPPPAPARNLTQRQARHFALPPPRWLPRRQPAASPTREMESPNLQRCSVPPPEQDGRAPHLQHRWPMSRARGLPAAVLPHEQTRECAALVCRRPSAALPPYGSPAASQPPPQPCESESGVELRTRLPAQQGCCSPLSGYGVAERGGLHAGLDQPLGRICEPFWREPLRRYSLALQRRSRDLNHRRCPARGAAPGQGRAWPRPMSTEEHSARAAALDAWNPQGRLPLLQQAPAAAAPRREGRLPGHSCP